MRVLLQIRQDYATRPGGDATQAERTAEELRALGVEADLSGNLMPDLTPYDLVHVFNTQVIEDPFRQTVHARRWGRPVVLSPIYWDIAPYRRHTRRAVATRWERDGWAALDGLELARQRLVFAAASLLLPNSQAEAAVIARQFAGLTARVRVVPNGVDARYAGGDGARFCGRHGLKPRGFVLCAARKEERKNQLGLIEACDALGLPVVLAGAETPQAGDYPARCRDRAATSRAPVRFLPHLGPDELADAYAAARVHALPSFFETVGLASVEAALGGCNIVTTRASGAREYLGEAAWYCDPHSVDSIREAVGAAFAAPLEPARYQTLAARWSWRRAAEETLRGYEDVMNDTESTPPDEGHPAQWLPALPPDEYIAHLESLFQLQLEAMAYRDAQHHALEEYARRVEQAYRETTANALEQQQYIVRLEAALRAAQRRSVRGRLRRLWRRYRKPPG